ncbi:MAG: hypothetical protein ACXU8O_09180 [Asticcacaulis sp.]
MQNEPLNEPLYEIRLYPRGPKSCEWKVWPKSGGPAKAAGVAPGYVQAEAAAQKAMDKLAKQR